MKLAVLVKYLGTSFEGFQAQPSGNTVQQHLTEAMSRVFGFPCNVTGCSRTDSGVHANGFVASVEPSGDHPDDWCTIPPERFHRATVQYLPEDIAVVGTAVVPDSFHPRYSALGKEYIYIIKDSPAADPFLRGRTWQVRRPISPEGFERMQMISEKLKGTHDFGAFMSKGSKITDTVRTVTEAKVERCGETVCFTVSADGFLYNMVRIMTGTLVGAAYGDIVDVDAAFETLDRSLLGVTAPAEGLYLNRVIYGDEIQFKSL